MADDDKKKDENGGEEQEGGKSKKKLIIIISLVAVLAIGLSVGATLFFLGGSDNAAPEDAAATEPVKEVKKPAIYYDIKPPIIVTFNINNRQRYMQVFISVVARDQAPLDKLELHMPLIRNKLIVAYSNADFAKLQTNEGKVELQKQTLEIINAVITGEGADPVEQVLFTNFVMQ